MRERRPLPPGVPKPVSVGPLLMLLIPVLGLIGVGVAMRETEQRAVLTPPVTTETSEVPASQVEAREVGPAPQPVTTANDLARTRRRQAFVEALEALAQDGQWMAFTETYADKLIFEAEPDVVATECPQATPRDRARLAAMQATTANDLWVEDVCASPQDRASQRTLNTRWSTHVLESAAGLMRGFAGQLGNRPELAIYLPGTDFDAAFQLIGAQVRSGTMQMEDAGMLLTLRSIVTGDTFTANRRRGIISAAGAEDLNMLADRIGLPLK